MDAAPPMSDDISSGEEDWAAEIMDEKWATSTTVTISRATNYTRCARREALCQGSNLI